MAELKTKPTEQSVESFLQGIENDKRRRDGFTILNIMKEITQLEPKMWGPTIVGFGQYHYKYASGHEGDSFLTGFSPRKQNLTLYIMPGFSQYDTLMSKLGKFKIGKSCLYLNKIEDINLDVLKDLIRQSLDYMKKMYKESQA